MVKIMFCVFLIMQSLVLAVDKQLLCHQKSGTAQQSIIDQYIPKNMLNNPAKDPIFLGKLNI